jgi:hypothetical protein
MGGVCAAPSIGRTFCSPLRFDTTSSSSTSKSGPLALAATACCCCCCVLLGCALAHTRPSPLVPCSGAAALSVFWSSPSVVKTLIPASAFWYRTPLAASPFQNITVTAGVSRRLCRRRSLSLSRSLHSHGGARSCAVMCVMMWCGGVVWCVGSSVCAAHHSGGQRVGEWHGGRHRHVSHHCNGPSAPLRPTANHQSSCDLM